MGTGWFEMTIKEYDKIPVEDWAWEFEINRVCDRNLTIKIWDDGDICISFCEDDDGLDRIFRVEDLEEIVRRTKMFIDRRIVYLEKQKLLPKNA